MPGNPHYVLDSSIIAKWFVQEKDSEKAVEIRDLFIREKIRLSTISLARYELGNILWKHPSKTEDNVREDFEALSEMALPTQDLEDPQVLTRAFHTARDLRITFCDASFVAWAEVSKATFVTADEPLYRKTKGRGDVILLRDWTGPKRPVRVKAGRSKWGREAFPDAGEATFGD